jgi:hypothetical protein
LATIAALILGTLAAAAVYRFDFFGKDAVSFMLILPLALPGIVTGIAMRSAISLMNIPFTFWTIIIGHATFSVVVVYNNVIARFRRSSIHLQRPAARSADDAIRVGTGQHHGGIAAAAIDDDHFVSARPQRRQRSQVTLDAGGFVQHGDDDGKSHERRLHHHAHRAAVTAWRH